MNQHSVAALPYFLPYMFSENTSSLLFEKVCDQAAIFPCLKTDQETTPSLTMPSFTIKKMLLIHHVDVEIFHGKWKRWASAGSRCMSWDQQRCWGFIFWASAWHSRSPARLLKKKPADQQNHEPIFLLEPFTSVRRGLRLWDEDTVVLMEVMDGPSYTQTWQIVHRALMWLKNNN